jgi:RimJ/RimL family protein N-acetyltransferase
VTATLSRSRDDALARFTVRRLTDPDHLRELLSADRPYAAYALAQLDPGRFGRSEWFEARSSDDRHGLVVHSNSGLGQALFAQGDPVAVASVLKLHPGARFTFGSLKPEHHAGITRYFLMARPQRMTRMLVTAETFKPGAISAVRLSAAHITEINRLYSLEGGPAYYRPSHLEEGVYCGVYDDGRLVAIAGTHVVSEREGVAVVGNVFTHPRYRAQGHSTSATSAVTAQLLERCPLVVLTVEEGNEPALAVYRKLGYTPHCALHESPLIRKEPLGVVSAARRLMADWRGRATGTEVVLR